MLKKMHYITCISHWLTYGFKSLEMLALTMKGQSLKKCLIGIAVLKIVIKTGNFISFMVADFSFQL